jgi:cobalt transporter subunit CbtA
MITRYLLAALAAGLLAGVLMTPVQYTRIVPLILAAEEYEPGGSHYVAPAVEAHEHAATETMAPMAADAHNHHEMAPGGEEQTLFLGRFWNTVFANLVAGAGFGLLLAGVSLALGADVTVNNGMIWGIAAWLAVQFLPSLGLPPELPGFPEVDLVSRQVWWVATIIASVIGIALIVLRVEIWQRLGGLVLLVLPHLYGAPQPVDVTSAVPAFYASQFTVAALATTLFFWLVLGLALGWFMDRTKAHE